MTIKDSVGFTRAQRFFWIGLALVHLVLPWALRDRMPEVPDESAYRGLARNIVDKHSYHLDFPSIEDRAGVPNTHYGPGWPGILALGYLVTGNENGFWVILSLVWLANLFLMGAFAKQMGLGRPQTAALVVWLTAYPTLLFYHGHLMTESVCITLSLLLLLSAFRFAKTEQVRWLVAFGLLSGISQLVRTQLLLIPIAFFILLCRRVRFRQWLSYGLLFILVHGLVISPWLLRMRQLGSHGIATELKLGFNLYKFNSSTVDNPYRQNVVIPPEVAALPPDVRDKRLTRMTLYEVLSDPMHYLKLCFFRMGYLFSPVANFSKVSFLQNLLLFLTTVFFIYVPLAWIGLNLWRKSRMDFFQQNLVLILALWYLFHFAVNASIRNRLPSDYLLATLALSPGFFPQHWGRRIPWLGRWGTADLTTGDFAQKTPGAR